MYKLTFILISITIFIYCIANNLKINDFKEDRYINVEVKGNVNKDIYLRLPIGSKIKDAIDKASIDSDSDLSSISELDTLHNNQVIVIPKKTEVKKISINSGSFEELITLPGIGESIANRIIQYREKYGCFENLEEIMNIKGIGDSKYERIKEYICL